jgi:hypothetical protein
MDNILAVKKEVTAVLLIFDLTASPVSDVQRMAFSVRGLLSGLLVITVHHCFVFFVSSAVFWRLKGNLIE